MAFSENDPICRRFVSSSSSGHSLMFPASGSAWDLKLNRCRDSSTASADDNIPLLVGDGDLLEPRD